MEARSKLLKDAMHELGLEWREESKMTKAFVNGAGIIQLQDLLWKIAEMNFLKTRTDFDNQKKVIYDEISKGPYIPKRGLVSERAKNRVVADNNQAYVTFRQETLEKISDLCDTRIKK